MESYARPVEVTGPGVTYPHGVSSRYYLECDGMSQVPGSGSQWSPGGGGYMTTGGTAGRLVTKGIIVGVPVALTVVSLVGVGKFLKAAGAIRAADAALVRLYQTGRIPWLGASTYYPPGWIGPAVTIAGGTVSTWFTPSSAGGGGPGEIPNLHRLPPSIEETGEILSNSPSAPYPEPQWLQKGRARVLKETRCPKGFRWSDRYKRCVRKTEMWRRRQRKG